MRVNYQFQSPIKNTQQGKMATLLRGWTLGGTLTATLRHAAYSHRYRRSIRNRIYRQRSRAGNRLVCDLRFRLLQSPRLRGASQRYLWQRGSRYHSRHPELGDSLSASFFRSFRIDEKRRIEFRIDSTNTLNHVNVTNQINTTVGSIQYGLPTAAGNMRSVTATVRLRF